MKITTWAQLEAAIAEQTLSDREEASKIETMKGWKDDGYSAEWTAKRMGYVDAVDENKTFYIYWRDGKKQKMQGRDIADAFARAGFGGGAINAVDFYKEGVDNYEWNKETRNWDNTGLVLNQGD